MLTKVTSYGPLAEPLELPLTIEGREATEDFLQVRNIDGLGPIKATVNTSPYGNSRGVAITGTSTADRNIVITLGPNPDWNDWTPSKIRDFVYQYFMPELGNRLVFESDDKNPMEISGIVESCEPLIFSKDNEIQVSLICADPDFTGLEPIVVEISSDGPTDGTEFDIDYAGTLKTGMILTITYVSGPEPTALGIHCFPTGGLTHGFSLTTGIGADRVVKINSRPGEKYVHSIIDEGLTTVNDLDEIVYPGSEWPFLTPGPNTFYMTPNVGGVVRAYEIEYFEKFGGL